jgi:hypothetical protein
MIYPEALEVNGVEYEINTGFEDALACLRCINDSEISSVERALGVVEILYKETPDDLQEAVRMAVKYLQLGKDPEETQAGGRKQDMDFGHDIHYIRASFRSDYGIDLARERDMHWWEFSELLQGLTDNCVLNRVRDLRNYDLSTVKDPKARSRIAKAQREVALPAGLSKEEQDTLDAFYAQLKC